MGSARLWLAVPLLAAACGAPLPEPAEPPPNTVVMREIGFHPPELVVRPGTVVTWANQERGVVHSATAEDGSFDTGLLRPGRFASIRFDREGSHAYVCSLHPEMRGVVHVRP